MLNIEELKMSLKLYKESLGEERLKVKEDKRQPVEIGQVRVLFWMPNEYVLIYHTEDEGLVHAVPLTVWVSLTTCPLRLHIKDRIFAPLPFVVYLRKEILEQESYPIAGGLFLPLSKSKISSVLMPSFWATSSGV